MLSMLCNALKKTVSKGQLRPVPARRKTGILEKQYVRITKAVMQKIAHLTFRPGAGGIGGRHAQPEAFLP